MLKNDSKKNICIYTYIRYIHTHIYTYVCVFANSTLTYGRVMMVLTPSSGVVDLPMTFRDINGFRMSPICYDFSQSGSGMPSEVWMM